MIPLKDILPEGFIKDLPIEAEAAAYRIQLDKIKEQWQELKCKIRAGEEITRLDITNMDELLRRG